MRCDRMLHSQSLFPRFISNDCFLLAQSYMVSLDYSGPTVLACDDTKLHPSLQVVWDTAADSNILVGSTINKVVLVANPDELQNLLEELKDKAATKVCVELR